MWLMWLMWLMIERTDCESKPTKFVLTTLPRRWHHHISVVRSCYAFIVGERVRRFPSAGRNAEAHSIAVAA